MPSRAPARSITRSIAQNTLFAIALLAFALLAFALLPACATGPSATASLDRAIADYDAGRFTAAFTEAERAASRGNDSLARDEAAYLAGLSAYRLGRDVDARRWLTASSTSADAWLAGQSLVTLGSVESRGGDDRAAARAFVRAAERLPDPDEAARARAAAGWAYRELGDEANAKDQFALAKVPAAGPSQVTPQPRIPLPASGTPPLVERPSTPPPPTGAFTIQAGAFRDADRARSRAAEIAERARELGLGSPAVRSKRSAAGAEMWVVQVGRFADRASAEKVKAKLGAVNLSVERVTAGG